MRVLEYAGLIYARVTEINCTILKVVRSAFGGSVYTASTGGAPQVHGLLDAPRQSMYSMMLQLNAFFRYKDLDNRQQMSASWVTHPCFLPRL